MVAREALAYGRPLVTTGVDGLADLVGHGTATFIPGDVVGLRSVIADDVTILDERVLNGLDDTYKSLGVPTGPTVRNRPYLPCAPMPACWI